MDMRWINIVPFFPDQTAYMAGEARRLTRKLKMVVPAYSMTLHPEGRQPLAKSEYFSEKFADLLEALRGTGIRPGILLQSLMGHGWRGQALCGIPWQYTVDINGKTAYRMCPLDPGFRQYIRDTVRLLARLHPAFFLVDDDVRLINNSTAGLECFCPLHMAAFQAESPLRFTAAELRRHLLGAPAGDATAELFDRVRRRSLLDLAALIRSAIDETDERISCGYCAGGREYLLMESMARTLAGKNEPFLRIHNAMYLEQSTQNFPQRMYHTNLMKKAAGTVTRLLDEADTCPHNRFSKSAIGMHAHITGGILNGLNGAKLWLTNLMEPESAESAEYENILAAHRGFYRELLHNCEEIDWQGPQTLLPPADWNWRPAHLSRYYEWCDWQWQYLNRFGIPGSYGAHDPSRTVLLCGESVRALPITDLTRILAGRVLLDGNAAFAVADRGLGELIGVTPVHRKFRFSCETMRESQRKMRFLNDFSAPFFEPHDHAVILSDLVMNPFCRSPAGKAVAPGTVWFENRMGGRVVCTAVAMENTIYNLLAPARKEWLVHLLTRLGGQPLPVYCRNNQDVYLRHGVTAEGKRLTALVNLSFDRLEKPALVVASPPREIWRLSGSGRWLRQPFSPEKGNVITLPLTLSTYESLVVRW